MATAWNPALIDISAGGNRKVALPFAIAGALFALLVIGLMFNAELRWVGLVMVGPLVAICGAVVYLMAQGAKKHRLSVHPEGIRDLKKGVERTLAWDDIESIIVKASDLQAGGVVGGLAGVAARAIVAGVTAGDWMNDPIYRASFVTILIRGKGQEIRLRRWDPRWLEAYKMIREQVEPRLYAQAKAALIGGAQFGPVRVSPEGVAFGSKDAVPFSEIEAVELGMYVVSIKRRGKLLRAGSAAVARIPNLHVMMALVDEARAGAGGPPVAAPRAS